MNKQILYNYGSELSDGVEQHRGIEKFEELMAICDLICSKIDQVMHVIDEDSVDFRVVLFSIYNDIERVLRNYSDLVADELRELFEDTRELVREMLGNVDINLEERELFGVTMMEQILELQGSDIGQVIMDNKESLMLKREVRGWEKNTTQRYKIMLYLALISSEEDCYTDAAEVCRAVNERSFDNSAFVAAHIRNAMKVPEVAQKLRMVKLFDKPARGKAMFRLELKEESAVRGAQVIPFRRLETEKATGVIQNQQTDADDESSFSPETRAFLEELRTANAKSEEELAEIRRFRGLLENSGET